MAICAAPQLESRQQTQNAKRDKQIKLRPKLIRFWRYVRESRTALFDWIKSRKARQNRNKRFRRCNARQNRRPKASRAKGANLRRTCAELMNAPNSQTENSSAQLGSKSQTSKRERRFLLASDSMLDLRFWRVLFFIFVLSQVRLFGRNFVSTQFAICFCFTKQAATKARKKHAKKKRSKSQN